MLTESVELVAVTTTLYAPGVVALRVDLPGELPDPHPMAAANATKLNRRMDKALLLRGMRKRRSAAMKAIPEHSSRRGRSAIVVPVVVIVRVLVAGEAPEICTWPGDKVQAGGYVAVPLP